MGNWIVRALDRSCGRVAAGAAALAVLAAAPAEAQERIPAFELGVYGGGAWSSDWMGINDDYTPFGDAEGPEGGFGIGFAPAFGATASWYFTPAMGLRLHGGYMPSELPTYGDDDLEAFGAAGPAVAEVELLAEDESDYPLNNYLADLSLVFRPWIGGGSGLLGSTYLFLGGGVLMSDPAGDAGTAARAECVEEYVPLGACLPYERDYGTVGQGTAGLGFNLFPLTSALGLFGELAVHAYDSPVHTVDEDDPLFGSSLVEDRFAVTPRAVVGLKLALGDLSTAVAPVPVAPQPRPTPAPAPAPAPREEAIRVCVVENGALTEVDALYLPADGDTVVVRNGVRRDFSDLYPARAPAYATGEGWLLGNETVRLGDSEYVKFGVPRIVPPTQLSRVGEFEGVGLYAETGATAPHAVLYIPLRPGCQFQPYQLREQIRVRG